MPVVDLLDIERLIAHRAWPYSRVVEALDELEREGADVASARLLACDLYERPDEEMFPLLAALIERPMPLHGRYQTLLAQCATRPRVGARFLPGMADELERFQRVLRAIREDGHADVRSLEGRLEVVRHMVQSGAAHDDVLRAADELQGAYRAPALALVLESAIGSGQSDAEVERVLSEYLDHEVDPLRRALATLDACRARDDIASRRLQPLISELRALETLLRSAYRHSTARDEKWRFPGREAREEYEE